MENQTNGRVRVLIVDDHPVVRAGLASMLGANAELEIIGSASGGQEALSILRREAVDVVLLDLRMPAMSGIDTLRALEGMQRRPRVIILSSYEMDEDVYRTVQAGAMGYVLKDASEDEMIQAIKTVHSGKRHLPRHIASRLADRMLRSDLTNRELEILRMLAKGLTNKSIAKALKISDNTVRNHVISILGKLEVSDRTEAATTAILRGIIQPEE